MGDLEYAVADLRALGKRLHSLRDGLASDGPLCHVDKYDVNSRHVIDALNEFANDWDDKREGLAKSLGSLGDMVTKAADSFTAVDEDLAKKVLHTTRSGSAR